MTDRFGQNAGARAILAHDAEVLVPVYARFPVVMERGEGVFLFDSSGNRYLDLMAGLGVNALGHAHPRLLRAMAEQAGQLVHLSPQYAHRYPGQLAEKLCDLAGMRGAFFSTGGTEAVEGALKLAHTHARQNYGPGKRGIVALRQSYHGRSYGALSVTGQERYRMDFGPGIPHVSFVDRNDAAALEAEVGEQTAAILLEPILGEGGVHGLTPAYLAQARRLADKHGALLIFDEIQCGLGRTGDWFAFEESGVRPDMLILGKPLGGGLPLSALLVNDDLFHSFGIAKHGSTLGGSPFLCRLGLEFLAVVEEDDLLSRVQDTGEYLKQQLQKIVDRSERAAEVRGRGLLLGLELREPARPIAETGLERGFLLNLVQGSVLRFLPPFLLEREHVDQVSGLLNELLAGAPDKESNEAAQAVAATV